MLTPRHWTRALHRSGRASVLAALLALLACGKDGDHYAPLPNDHTPHSTVVAGAVRDASDHVVGDALVVIEPVQDGVTATTRRQVENPGAPGTSTPGRRVTVTGDNGRFAFPDVAKGEYFLQVIADDHLGAMRNLSVPDPIALVDTIYVDVDLTPTGTFSGVATLENAVNHQGTVVYAEGTSYVAVTDPSGNYALTDVPVGSYTVRAEHAGYLEDTEGGTITTAGEVVPLAAMLLRIDSNIPPVASIASASPLLAALPVNFNASGTDADGSVVLYEWDWEDDGVFDYSSASSANASHTYAAGSYRAKLRVTDDDGAIGLDVVEFTVVNAPANRVYMATFGSDANDGSIGSPVATLTKAYQVAQLNGKDEILISEGSYSQVPVFQPGIHVLGGRLANWDEGPAYSIFNIVAARATANNITVTTRIRRVWLNMTSPATGTNSIALYSINSDSDLRFEECEFVSANGLGGSAGTSGVFGTAGGIGGTGGPGLCDMSPPGGGGAGGSSPGGCPGGIGGTGGPEGANNGSPGATGSCGGGSGGVGGGGGDPGGTGGQGNAGASGLLGAGGLPGSASGSVLGGEWVPAVSTTGNTGTSGRGGGGGGGGGGQGGTFIDDGSGNGGGGGGGGGSGGSGGTGGTGGRASFAVMLFNSSPTFDSCHFRTGVGGTGGNGGAGAAGGGGGAGGLGGAVCTGEVGRGGNGGSGGNGGNGGGGGGGSGGPSYGIYRASGSAPVVNSAIYTIGGGGTAGTGGSPNGTAGSSGLSGNIF
jgi:PKD domain/Carboxypeptidase regulatory-like domain